MTWLPLELRLHMEHDDMGSPRCAPASTTPWGRRAAAEAAAAMAPPRASEHDDMGLPRCVPVSTTTEGRRAAAVATAAMAPPRASGYDD